MNGRLTVKAKCAKLKRSTEWFSNMCPYVIISIGNQEKRTNVHQAGGKYPSWKDTFEFQLQGDQFIQCKIMDQDWHSADDLIGEASVGLAKALADGKDDSWYPIVYKGKDVGQIKMELAIDNLQPPTQINHQSTVIQQPNFAVESAQTQSMGPQMVLPRSQTHVPTARALPRQQTYVPPPSYQQHTQGVTQLQPQPNLQQYHNYVPDPRQYMHGSAQQSPASVPAAPGQNETTQASSSDPYAYTAPPGTNLPPQQPRVSVPSYPPSAGPQGYVPPPPQQDQRHTMQPAYPIPQGYNIYANTPNMYGPQPPQTMHQPQASYGRPQVAAFANPYANPGQPLQHPVMQTQFMANQPIYNQQNFQGFIPPNGYNQGPPPPPHQ